MAFSPFALTLSVVSAVAFATLPAQAQESIRDWSVAGSFGNFELRKGNDGFSDETRCVILLKGSPEVQVTRDTFFIGADRGSLESYRLRFDDEKPTDSIPASTIEKRIGSAIIEGPRFVQATKAKRLRIQGSTRYSGSFQHDYTLAGMTDAISAWETQSCPAE